MPGPEFRRVQTTATVVVALAAGASLVFAFRWVVGRSSRVLGWVAVATIFAAMLYPIVEVLARRLRRGLAILIVALGSIAVMAVVGKFVFDDVRRDLDLVRTVAPRSAARWEADPRVGRVLRDIQLRHRVQQFLDSIPARVAGGHGVAAVKSAATRGLAVFITLILTIFIVSFARSAVTAVSRWLPPVTLAHLSSAYRASHKYVTLMLVKSLGVAAVVFVLLRVADVPGAAVFALTAMLGSVFPRVGIVLIALPIALVDVAVHPGVGPVVLVVALGVVLQIVDWLVLHRWIEPRSIEVGSAVPLVLFLVGVDLWGIGAGLAALAVWPFLLAWWDLHARPHPSVLAAAGDGPPGRGAGPSAFVDGPSDLELDEGLPRH